MTYATQKCVFSDNNFKCDDTFSYCFRCWTLIQLILSDLRFFLFSSLFNIFIKFSLSTRIDFGDQSWWLIQNSTFKMFSQILQTSWLQPSVVQLASGSTFPSFQHLIRQLIVKHRKWGRRERRGCLAYSEEFWLYSTLTSLFNSKGVTDFSAYWSRL